jgi:hypothetical protein
MEVWLWAVIDLWEQMIDMHWSSTLKVFSSFVLYYFCHFLIGQADAAYIQVHMFNSLLYSIGKRKREKKSINGG